MNNIVEKYLRLDKSIFFICILLVSFILVYFQQEYVYIPQINDQFISSDKLRMFFLEQFSKYRWLTFAFTPIILIVRILLVGGTLYLGSLVFDNIKKMNYVDFFNIALKGDIILILASIVYSIVFLSLGYEDGVEIIKYLSFMAFGSVKELDSWLIIPLGMFNFFEIVYCLVLAKLYSSLTNSKYSVSLTFVMYTYGTFFFLYVLFTIFITLCIV